MMPIDAHTAITAVGLANNALSAVKTAFDLGKKVTDLELKQHLSDAVDNVLELKLKVHELVDENRSLREQLELRGNIKREPKHGFWLKEGETQPLCPKCFEGERRSVVYLQAARFVKGLGYVRSCNVCDGTFDSGKLVHDSDFANS